jgi:hypothetical protein
MHAGNKPQLVKGLRIISGGQTGADRAALDWAIAHDISHGGWCPKDRWAEDGAISRQYQLQETPVSDPAQRTEWNVRDSDGTVIFSMSEKLSGGSLRTWEFARRLGKPCLHLCQSKPQRDCARELRAFVRHHAIKVLNVAGPRASAEPQVGAFVHGVLGQVFGV